MEMVRGDYIVEQDSESPLVFIEEPLVYETNKPENSWKLLVVDDDKEIHHVTRMVFDDFHFSGKPLEIISAYSAEEARVLMAQHSDIAVILLDVVMENDDSGLVLVKEIRDTMQNHNVQIILRTGHPGQAPEYNVITRFEINDYREKRELTAKRLLTCVTTAIRAYVRSKSLSEALEHQRLLAKKLVDIQELERISIARELHDEVGQMLTALSVGLEICIRNADQNIKSKISEQKEIVNDLAKKVRTLILDLSPTKLKENGLVESINWYLRNTLGGTGIRIEFNNKNINHLRFDFATEIAVFRVIQETITNAIKYSRSSSITIRLSYNGSQIILRVRDYGKGFNINKLTNRPDHMGITGMYERASAANGTLHVFSKIKKGTLISLCIPVNEKEVRNDKNSSHR